MAGPNLGQGALTSGRHKVLKSAALAASEAIQYTVPAGQSVEIKSGSLCNTSGGSLNLSLSVVPSGGTASAVNRVFAVKALAAGAELSLKDLLGGTCLSEGDFISTLASGTGVALVLTGVVYGG